MPTCKKYGPERTVKSGIITGKQGTNAKTAEATFGKAIIAPMTRLSPRKPRKTIFKNERL
jgi:hypothetical protein